MKIKLPERDALTLPILILASVGALAASWTHYHGAMRAIEPVGRWWSAPASATAVDVAIIAATFAAATLARRGAGRTDRGVAMGVVLLVVGLSVLANVDDGLTWAIGGGKPVTWAGLKAADPLMIFRIAAFRGGLPIASFLLAILVDRVAAVTGAAPVAAVARSKAIRASDSPSGGPEPDGAAGQAGGAHPAAQALPAPVLALLEREPAATLDEIGRAIGRHRSRAAALMSRAGWARGASGAWQVAAGD